MIRHPVAAVRTYVLVWVALMILLTLTLGSAYIPLGSLNTVINLGIAVAKALLVMLFFMHLRSGHPVLRIFASAGFFWLALLIGLSLTDFLTR
ncbi:MAG TPA: cytochrome C oxidase subunit IV family protein, partial [Casimicrobiaceae bacterium]|nr:cytochrome C oxidase subunit IV family protein [Casimicrobiaceae bacterium]